MIRLPGFIRTSIQNKLFSSFLIILLFLLAEITASFIIIGSLGKASDKILKMNYNSVTASMRMMDHLEEIQREFIIAAASPDSNDPQRMLEAQSSFSEWLGRAKDNITENGEKNIIAAIDSLYNQYVAMIQRALRTRETSLPVMAKIEYKMVLIRSNCLDLQHVNQVAMFRKSSAAQRIARKGTLTLILMTALILILGIALSWGLSRRIVRPILILKEATQRLARGDYSIQLHNDSEDELGILTEEFDAMAEKLWGFNQLNIRKTLAEEQKSAAILANIQEGIFFVGADFTIRDANKAALNAINLERSEVIGHHFLEIIKQDKLFADLKTCLEKQRFLAYNSQDNILTLTKDNKKTYLEYFLSPVLSDQKELLGALFLLRDVTKLKELDRLKSEFVMIVSHELKTPLTSINMSIDLLKESLGKSPRTEDIELITIAKDEINRLRLLINDLLDLSKIEAGKLEMTFAPAAPAALLESVAQYFKNQVAEKNATLEINCPTTIRRIWCDEEKLMLVFSNLIANALKAIADQGKIILLAEMSGEFVLFCVRDNGMGIPLAYQNRIFDRFVQVEEPKAARGTGLGLTISREIVRAHGGSIWVESDTGQGAAFYFTIPIEPQSL